MKKESDILPFLNLLAEDMKLNPHRLHPLTNDRFEESQKLVEGVKLDFDEELSEETK